MKLEETLKDLRGYIEIYSDVTLDDGEQLNYLLQKISTTVYFLTEEKSKYKKLYELKIFELTKEKMTVSRAVNVAETEYPELYLLRYVIDNANRIIDAIRTNISYLKSEKNNTKNQ